MSFAFCLFLITIITAQAVEFDKINKECMAVSKIPQEVLDQDENGEEVTDPRAKVHLLCLLKKAHLVGEDGDISEDILKAMLKQMHIEGAEADEVVKKCVVKGDTPEETAWMVLTCVKKEEEQQE